MRRLKALPVLIGDKVGLNHKGVDHSKPHGHYKYFYVRSHLKLFKNQVPKYHYNTKPLQLYYDLSHKAISSAPSTVV